MKAILKFDFNEDNDDRNDFRNCIEGVKWKSLVWELDQGLRAKTKYAPDDLSEDTYEAYQEIRDTLHELMDEADLNLN